MTDTQLTALFESFAADLAQERALHNQALGVCSKMEHKLAAMRDLVYDDEILSGGNGGVAVPYRSQWDDDARINASDCGPASLAMVLQWRGVNVKIDDLAASCGMGASKRYTVGGDLVATAAKHVVKMTHRFDATLPAIEAELNAGRPVIVLLHYGTLKPYVQDKVYISGHWLVVTGFIQNDVIVNDPNFRGDMREKGFGLQIPRSVFEQAMKDNALDGNRANQAVFVTAPKG